MNQSRLPPALADVCELRPTSEKKIGERRTIARGETMGGHARRFIHDQDRFIFINDLNRELGIGSRIRGQPDSRTLENELVTAR